MRISTMKGDVPLIKRELEGGDLDSFPMVYRSRIINHEFDDIDSFIDIYETIQEEQGALLQGKAFVDGYQRRLTIPDEKTGDPATLDTETSINLFVVDLDKIPSKTKVGTDEHFFEVYELLGKLDPVFVEADSIFAYSSSAGVLTTKNTNPWYTMNAHVYYLIPDSTQRELRHIFGYLNKRARDLGLVPKDEKLLDASIIKLSQPIYVAGPKLKEDLNLTRGILRRAQTRLLNIEPWKQHIPDKNQVPKQEFDDAYEETTEEISDFDKDVARSLIYGNVNGESYSGMLSVITYLKQRKHSRTQVQKLWNEIYTGDNWTLEDQELFDKKWFDIKYIEPDYFTNLEGKDNEVYLSTGYNNGYRCLVPDWDITTLKLLSTKVHKPIVLLLSSELQDSTIKNIYRRAIYAGFKSVKVERYKGRSIKKVNVIIEEAPGGMFDDFVL